MLGLVDLSRIPSGTFFLREIGRSTLFRKWGTNIDKTTSPDVGDLAPKARKTFFDGSSESVSALFFVYRRPQGICSDLTSKATARTNNGNPAVLFSQCCKPHLANWKKMCLSSTFFCHSARSPHRATKPSRGWLRVVVRELRLVLVELDRAGNKVTARARAYCRGCGDGHMGVVS